MVLATQSFKLLLYILFMNKMIISYLVDKSAK